MYKNVCKRLITRKPCCRRCRRETVRCRCNFRFILQKHDK